MPPPHFSPESRPLTVMAAFCVHGLTASGAAVALCALHEAARAHWVAMFAWLAVALVIDAIDGPIARRLEVARQLPNWSGEILDLVVDFVTYVFVPAYAIMESGLVLPVVAPFLGGAIVVSGALYFADQRMKTDDNHFRGFPALWNAAAFYLFLLQAPPLVATLLLGVLVVLTFAPFHVLHPLRVLRLRRLTLCLIGIGAGLGAYTLMMGFDVSFIVRLVLCAIALHILCSDAVIRLTGKLA